MTDGHIEIETLSAFADGELNAVLALKVEKHVAECGECRATLERIRGLVGAAASMSREIAPPAEAWTAIRKRVPTIESRVPSRWWHNGWLAAAAAIVLVVGTASLMILLRPNEDAMARKLASMQKGAPVPAALVALDRNYQPAIAELRDAFEAQRARMSPSTARTLEHSLAVIDAAIAEAREACVADPGSGPLLEMLTGYYQRKVDFLKRAAAVAPTL